MSWLILFFAGLLETVWATGLKYTHGFTRPLPTIGTLLAMTASVWLLSVAMRELPLGTAYAIWTGIGAVGAVILGVVLFHDPLTFPRLLCVGLIVTGLVGLKMVS
ncbi:MAG: quaternary ammonium compound efflux SMR transporter SugE [Deltaproteobacteria bacterium]|nr:quaternary ammonium compound efflux SMR transporter SugE [Deltaproteobacteria bacterium]